MVFPNSGRRVDDTGLEQAHRAAPDRVRGLASRDGKPLEPSPIDPIGVEIGARQLWWVHLRFHQDDECQGSHEQELKDVYT